MYIEIHMYKKLCVCMFTFEYECLHLLEVAFNYVRVFSNKREKNAQVKNH